MQTKRARAELFDNVIVWLTLSNRCPCSWATFERQTLASYIVRLDRKKEAIFQLMGQTCAGHGLGHEYSCGFLIIIHNICEMYSQSIGGIVSCSQRGLWSIFKCFKLCKCKVSQLAAAEPTLHVCSLQQFNDSVDEKWIPLFFFSVLYPFQCVWRPLPYAHIVKMPGASVSFRFHCPMMIIIMLYCPFHFYRNHILWTKR